MQITMSRIPSLKLKVKRKQQWDAPWAGKASVPPPGKVGRHVFWDAPAVATHHHYLYVAQAGALFWCFYCCVEPTTGKAFSIPSLPIIFFVNWFIESGFSHTYTPPQNSPSSELLIMIFRFYQGKQKILLNYYLIDDKGILRKPEEIDDSG